jgi:hypothetical protein
VPEVVLQGAAIVAVKDWEQMSASENLSSFRAALLGYSPKEPADVADGAASS